MGYQSNVNKIIGTVGGVKLANDKKNITQEQLRIQAQNADTQAKFADTLPQKYAVEEHKLQVKEQKNKLVEMQEKSRQKANNLMLANIKQVKDLKQQRRLLKEFNKQFQEEKNNKKGGDVSDKE